MIGAVSGLWRYPVKSMGGERCQSVLVEHRGVRGDRRFAVRDAEGRFGSGKTTRRFRRLDGLLEFTAAHLDTHAEISFPDGRTMRSDDPAVHQALSSVFRTPLTLAEEAQATHFDAAPVHLLTTASMEWLRAALPNAIIGARRFRPNLLIETPGCEPLEGRWIGKCLRIGRDVELRIAGPTERCGMVALAQGADLNEDPAVLRAITQKAALCFGVYATVAKSGMIALGDPVSLVTPG